MYVKEVFYIALNSTEPDTLANHLGKIATQHIGLGSDGKRDLAATTKYNKGITMMWRRADILE